MRRINWRQRSRVQWLKEGDRNIAFFHRQASNRKSRSIIKGLRNADGEWITEPSGVSAILTQYYKDIFRVDTVDTDALNTVLDSIHTLVTPEMNAYLIAT